MQFRTADDAYPLSRLDYGTIDTGSTSVQIGSRLWNDRAVAVTGELLGTGDGVKTSFPTTYKPLVNHANCTIAVMTDGNPATGYTIDHTNGLVLFSTAPASGVVVTCNYAYSVGSTDAAAVVLVIEQTAAWAGDGATKSFSLASRCLQPIKVMVAGVEIPSSGYEIRDSGMTLFLSEAPTVNAAVQFYYVDTVCQGGYYEARSSGIDNPYSQTGFVDDSESAFYRIGGLFSVTGKLVGTGNGSTVAFSLGDTMVRSLGTVTVGGTETTDYALNNVTGVVTFGTAPSSGAEIRATYVYERSHRIGNIKQWCGRRLYLRAAIPQDAPNSVLTARLRAVSQ